MITMKPNTLESVIEVKVDGKITEKDMEEFKNYFKLKNNSTDYDLNILLIIKDMKGYSLQGLIDDLKFDAKHWNDVNKMAIVSDKTWIEMAAKVGNLMPKIQVKHFDKDNRAEALDWLVIS